jgi:hypothetical protein
MDDWKELAISVAIVLFGSLMLNFSELPQGNGKLFAYIGIGFLPVLVIQYKKNSKLNKGLNTSEFIFVLVLNTFMVLSFASIILYIMGKI